MPAVTHYSVRENLEGIAGLWTGKTFKIAGPTSLLQVFTVVAYDVFTKYCQSSRTCKYFILPGHLLYCQPGAEDLQFSCRLRYIDVPSKLWYESHLSGQYNCWSLRCSWSLSAMLQLHLHSWLNTWLRWIGQRQRRKEKHLGFGIWRVLY